MVQNQINLQLRYSSFGDRYTQETGIQKLMDDLGTAMAGDGCRYMLGGGNPAIIPKLGEFWSSKMARMAQTRHLSEALSQYDTPLGSMVFRKQLATYLNASCGWSIGPENIAITPGSQTSYFVLYNLFSGPSSKGDLKALFPLVPEYIGYADQGLDSTFARSIPAKLQTTGIHSFRYGVDAPAVKKQLQRGDVGICALSRPTNPSGNVLPLEEVEAIARLCSEHNALFVLDNAYGFPFPGMVYADADPIPWRPGMVQSFSLSKVGLPAMRTGMIVADPDVVESIGKMLAILNLAPPGLGQRLFGDLLEKKSNGEYEIDDLVTSTIQPFYAHRRARALDALELHCGNIDYRLHESEGSLFFWLWFPSMKITSKELYQKLVEQSVLTVPGEFFFFGQSDEVKSWGESSWQAHTRQCLRINFGGMIPEIVEEGIKVIAQVVYENS